MSKIPDRFSEHPWPTKVYILLQYAFAMLIALRAYLNAREGDAFNIEEVAFWVPWAAFHFWLGWGLSAFRPVPYMVAVGFIGAVLVGLLWAITAFQSATGLAAAVLGIALHLFLLWHLLRRGADFARSG